MRNIFLQPFNRYEKNWQLQNQIGDNPKFMYDRNYVICCRFIVFIFHFLKLITMIPFYFNYIDVLRNTSDMNVFALLKDCSQAKMDFFKGGFTLIYSIGMPEKNYRHLRDTIRLDTCQNNNHNLRNLVPLKN